ncbi:MAG: DNA phosphorothioation-associated protein 4 [Halothece sp. Uz-M2-17]|nr:DNA phosphorothioation-associated protein 4 [Halothece sp. Uz-M2-17]
MAVHRIRIAKQQAPLVQALTMGKESKGTFETYADVIMFAAAYGAKHQRYVPITSGISQDPAPISLEIFLSRGYDWVIKLIAIAHSQNPEILSPYDAKAQTQRLLFLEGLANGGLELLDNELRGAVDYSDRLLLILTQERFPMSQPPPNFDLTRFL